ncbi:MAG: ATP-grasp domain-containing protein [Asgard group archaeon]|nr:ATP-grasp domain-containing protein [Asgard group archaeon]
MDIILTKQKKITVLVTGADAPGFSSIARSLFLSKKFNIKLIATDWKTSFIAKHLAKKSFILPDNRSSDFVGELLRICQKEKVDVVIPIRTDDQLSICENLEEFNSINTIPTIVTPNPEIMKKAINKHYMLDYLREVAGLPTMDYRIAKTRIEFENALDQLGYPEKPIAIKPCHASGSRGFRILDPTKDRRQIFFDEKPNNTYSTKEEVLNILSDEFPQMLLMEYLVDPEYTIDILCYKGKTFAILPRRRTKMVGGITTKGVIEKLPSSMNTYLEKMVESYGFSYSVGIQIRQSAKNKGEYHVIEINPRLQGTTVMSVAAGINIPEIVIEMALKQFDFNFKPKIKYNLKLERSFIEFFNYNNNIFQLEKLASSEDDD